MKQTLLILTAALGLTISAHAGLRYNENFYQAQQNWDQYFYDQQIQQQIQQQQDQFNAQLNAYYQYIQAIQQHNEQVLRELQQDLEDPEDE